MSSPTTIQIRRGTTVQWTTNDPVLLNGEPGYDTDTGELKFGDGVTAWTSLSAISGGGGGATNLNGLTDVTITTPSTNQVLSYNGSQWVNGALPTHTHAWGDITSGVPAAVTALSGTNTGDQTPGGSTTHVQYNNGTTFSGDAGLTWDGTLLSASTMAAGSLQIDNDANIDGTLTGTIIKVSTNLRTASQSTVTAGGVTSLTISSKQIQRFTGASDQEVRRPAYSDGTAMGTGWTIRIINDGTGTLTIKDDIGVATLTQVFASGECELALTDAAGGTWVVRHIGSDVQTFLAGGTWTKRPGLKYAQAYVFAPGGGGSGGSRGDTSVARVGGGGGASGGVSSRFYRASELGGTENVTIGAFGAAGTAQAGTGNGGAGGTGGTTEFGTSTTLCRAIGGGGGSATGGAGATAQGTITTGQGGVASSGTGAAGTNGTLNFAGGVVIGSGASGGGITTGGAASAGGHRSSASLFMPLYGLTASTGAGTSGGGAGSAGANAVGFFGGVGGGGGGSSVTASVAGGAGGAGGFPGGGGGGGGAAGSTAGSSGVGGAGGAGVVYVVCYF